MVNKTFICEKCGEEFIQTGSAQKYCKDCKVVHTKEANMMRQWGRPTSPIADGVKKYNCGICGKQAVAISNQKSYCKEHFDEVRTKKSRKPYMILKRSNTHH